MPKSKKPRRAHRTSSNHVHQWTHADRKGVVRCTSCPATDKSDGVTFRSPSGDLWRATFDYLTR
jgi:hypothetical protein